MQTLLTFSNILKLLSQLEGNIQSLNEIYTSISERTVIDDLLIDQFLAQANNLSSAAAALKTITYTPPENPTP